MASEASYRRSSISIAWIWWFLTTLASSYGWIVNERDGLIFASITLGIGCGVAFFRQGKWRVTATSVYFLSIGALVAAPTAAIGLSHSEVTVPGLLDFTAAVSVSTVLTYSLRTGMGLIEPQHQPTRQRIDVAASGRWLTAIGVASLACALVLAGLRVDVLYALTLALASIGVVALATNVFLLLRGRLTRAVAAASLVALIAFLAFITTFFSGSGRLIPIGLLLAAMLVATTISPQHWQKLLIASALIPAFIIAGLIGTDRSASEPLETTLSDIAAEQRGLGSWTSPVETAALLISYDRTRVGSGFQRQYGITYIEALAIPIPRPVWPAKPPGFGTRLTEELAPSLLRIGHSMTATSFGEAYVNFAWIGFALFGAAMAPALAALDRWQLRIAHSKLDRSGVVRLLIFAVIVAGFPDFIWGGLASTIARAGIRVLVLLALYPLAVRLDTRAPLRVQAGVPANPS